MYYYYNSYSRKVVSTKSTHVLYCKIYHLSTYPWTRGSGTKFIKGDTSNPASSMIVVPLNLRMKHGRLGWPDRQYCIGKREKQDVSLSHDVNSVNIFQSGVLDIIII